MTSDIRRQVNSFAFATTSAFLGIPDGTLSSFAGKFHHHFYSLQPRIRDLLVFAQGFGVKKSSGTSFKKVEV